MNIVIRVRTSNAFSYSKFTDFNKNDIKMIHSVGS